MIPINAYPAYIRGGKLHLKYLSRYPQQRIRETIELMEKHRGRKVTRERLIGMLREIFPSEHDLRVINLIYYSLLVFYKLSEEKLSFTTSGRIRVRINDEWDLRLLFYQWVQETFGGFIPIEKRESAMLRFCEEYGVRRDALESVLAGGMLRGYKLIRRTSIVPSPEDIIAVSNFLLIEKTLGLSDSATIYFYDVSRKGSLIKDMIFRSKRARLILEFKEKNNMLICSLSGPLQIFKHPSPIYGEYISYILVGSLAAHRKWRLRAWVRYRKRKALYEISSYDSRIRLLEPPWKYHGKRRKIEAFDSEIEMKIYNLLRRIFPEARILRESEIISTEDGTIFIPDIVVEKNNRKAIVEIAGFWTENYAKKKREKLDAAYRSGIRNLVVVADKKLSKHFRNTQYPVLYFDKSLAIARSLRQAIGNILTGKRNYQTDTIRPSK